MRRARQWLSWIVLALWWTTSAGATPRRDPLTDPEIDQLRDTAQEPDLRIKLYIKFARDRLTSVEQTQSDPKITDRQQQMHDKLRDFVDLYDELNDNLDTYADRRNDLRKALKMVIEADNEFQAKLRALKESAASSKDGTKQYDFVLSDALDDVDKSATDHRQLLTQQEEDAKHKRLVKPSESPRRPD
jgi:hypothetical protein